MLTCFIVIILFISQGQSAMQLDLKGPKLKGRDPVLVRGFVSYLPGTCLDPEAQTLIDAGGRLCPAEFKATARWSDGSVRYLSIKAVVESRRAGGHLKLMPKVSVRTESVLSGEVELVSGDLCMKVSSKSDALIDALLLAGEKRAEARLELRLDGETYLSRPPRHVLLRSSNAEQVVKVQGVLQSRFSGAGPDYSMELTVPRGALRMYVRLKIDGGEGFSDGIVFKLIPFSMGKKPLVRITGCEETTSHKGKVRLSARNGALYVEDSEDRELLAKGGSALFSAGSLTLGLPRFAALHPWSVLFDPASGIELSLLSDSFQWEEGFGCEREFIIEVRKGSRICGFPPETAGAFRGAGFGLAGDLRNRSFPFASMKTGISNDPLFPLYRKVSASLITALKREWATWDGYRDFGDYRTWFGHYANLEFDPVYGLTKRFLLTRRLDDVANAEIMARHWLRFDRATARDRGFPPGVPWVHGTDHRSEFIDKGHLWVDGILLLYFLSGEEEFLEAALCIGRYLDSQRLKSKVPERCAAWSLMALTALVDAGYEEFVAGMNEAAALINHRKTGAGYFRFDTARVEDSECLAANTWVTAGITMEALFRHFLLTGDRRSHDSIVCAGKWLKRSCRDPITGEWYQRLHYSMEDESLLKERTGTVEKENRLFLALGLARAGQISRDRSMLRMARGLMTAGLEELEEDFPALSGRALSVVLRTAPEVMTASMEGR